MCLEVSRDFEKSLMDVSFTEEETALFHVSSFKRLHTEEITDSITAKCYLFSIYFVLQTNKSQAIYTSLSCSFQFHNMYAVISTTLKDL